MIGMSKVQKVFSWIILLITGLLIVFPLWYLLVMSITPTDIILANKVAIIPTQFSLENVIQVWTTHPISTWIINTFIVSLVIVVTQVVTSAFAAYAFAFMEFKGKNVIFMMMLATMMVPLGAIVLSNYLMMSQWGLLNTYQAQILPFTAAAMGIFLLRQFYLTIAKELREAAVLDGCGNLKFLFNILIPLSKPAIGAFGIVSFLGSWNRYLWPLLVTNTDSMRVVQVGITSLQDSDAALSIGMTLAGVTLVTLPTMLIFAIGHKQLVAGLMAGAVKG